MLFSTPPPGSIGIKSDDWQIDHVDDDKSNNKVTNLEWVTKKENSRRAKQNSLLPQGSEHHGAKLTEDDVRKIRDLYSSDNYSQYDLAELFSVQVMQINRIVNRKRWTHVE